MKKETKSTEREQLELQERRLDGEFDRRRLIRFGYLSVAERRRLRETYYDLDERFEPDAHLSGEIEVGVFVVFMLGFLVGIIFGKEAGVIGCILAAVLYWLCAAIVLRGIDKAKGDRTELYWEWRGYRCDRHGRKIPLESD